MSSFQGKQTRRRKLEIESAPKTLEERKALVERFYRFARMVWWSPTPNDPGGLFRNYLCCVTDDRGPRTGWSTSFIVPLSRQPLLFPAAANTLTFFVVAYTRSSPTFRFQYNYLSSLQGPIGRGHPHHGNRIPGTPLHGHALEHERTS